jgi:hypothetical protein
MSKFNSIILKRYLHIQEEYAAAAAIIPGMLVELTSAGTVQKHSGAGKSAIPMFAIEDALQGKGINQNLAADNYAVGDIVRCWIPTRGDIVYALLNDEEKVVIGDFVESAGNGYLRKATRTNDSWESADANPGGGQHSIYTLHLVGQVLEAKDLTSLEGSESSAATATTTQYVQVRIV